MKPRLPKVAPEAADLVLIGCLFHVNKVSCLFAVSSLWQTRHRDSATTFCLTAKQLTVVTTNLRQRGRNTSFIVKDVYIRYRFPVTWPDSVSTPARNAIAGVMSDAFSSSGAASRTRSTRIAQSLSLPPPAGASPRTSWRSLPSGESRTFPVGSASAFGPRAACRDPVQFGVGA